MMGFGALEEFCHHESQRQNEDMLSGEKHLEDQGRDGYFRKYK